MEIIWSYLSRQIIAATILSKIVNVILILNLQFPNSLLIEDFLGILWNCSYVDATDWPR